MTIGTDYEPKYIELEDVPINGPDNYSSSDKRKAIYSAESALELDVNGGEVIPKDEITNAHKSAVMNYATHILTHGNEDSAQSTIGDMSQGTNTEYYTKFLDRYKSLVDNLISISSGSSNIFSVSVNTSDDYD